MGCFKISLFFLSVDPAMVGWWGGERSDFDSKNQHFLSSSIFFYSVLFLFASSHAVGAAKASKRENIAGFLSLCARESEKCCGQQKDDFWGI